MKITIKLTQRLDIQKWRSRDDSMCFVICKFKAQDISCAFCLCLLEGLKMNWIWVYIVWAKKLAVMHILVITSLPFMESG